MFTSVSDVQSAAGGRSAGPRSLPWLLVLVGLGAMYVPTFIDLFRGIWQSERNDYGPIVLAIAAWFSWFRFRQLLSDGSVQQEPAPWQGITLLTAGACCYAIGRSQGLPLLEVGSLIPVLAGIVAICFGAETLVRLWFAFFLMLFMVPLPASFVEAITQPMKLAVSFASEWALAELGYPITRDGVVLTIGHHHLLVADACAGLRSLFTLEALGLLYLNLVRHPSVLRTALLAGAIAPISFVANTLRVALLALLTYHYGYDAGQGYLHSVSGIVLFSSALLLIMGLDRTIGRFLPDESNALIQHPSTRVAQTLPEARPSARGLRSAAALMLCLPMLLAVAAAAALTPSFGPEPAMVRLQTMVPKQFGDWRAVESLASNQAGLINASDDYGALYDQVVMRTYTNSRHEKIMLALAYARDQRQDVKIHRPALCYAAQGFEIVKQGIAYFGIPNTTRKIAGEQLLVRNRRRIEAVSAWIRIGDEFPPTAWAMRMKILRDGLDGKVPDGILVRVSSLIAIPAEASAAYALQQDFISDLMTAVPPALLGVLVASPPPVRG